jgi:hypothetical protein
MIKLNQLSPPFAHLLKLFLTTLLVYLACSIQAQSTTVVDANSGRSNKTKNVMDKGEPSDSTKLDTDHNAITLPARNVSIPINTPGFGLKTGIANPIGVLKGNEFTAGSGMLVGINVGYDWSTFGLSFESGKFGFSLEKNLEARMDSFGLALDNVDEPQYTITYTDNAWKATYFGIGPRLTTGKGPVQFQIAPRIGLVGVKLPGYSVQTVPVFNPQAGGIAPYLLLDYPSESYTIPYLSFETSIKYQFSGNFSASVWTDYMSTAFAGPKEYTITFWEIYEYNQRPGYQIGELQDGGYEDKVVDFFLNTINVGVGLTYTFGKKLERKKTFKNKPEDREFMACFPPELKAPDNGQNYYLNKEDRPHYRWTDDPTSQSKVTGHVFKLYDETGKVIYQRETKKEIVTHNGELERVYKSLFNEKDPETAKRTLSWRVTTQYKDCEDQESGSKDLNFYKSGTDLRFDIINIECDAPPFDTSGNVNYSAEVTIKNDGDPSDNDFTVYPHEITISKDNNTGTPQISVTDLSYCTGSVPNEVLLEPGDDITVCFKFSLPFGETMAYATGYYSVGNNLGSSSVNHDPIRDNDSLPNCICNVCDDWRILPRNPRFREVNSPNANMQLSSGISIQNSDPIMEVKAEIVYVERNVSEENCSGCATDAMDMGLTPGGQAFQLGTPGSPNPWDMQGIATLVEDENGDGYANQLVWHADDPDAGIPNLASTFTISLNLPETPFEDCCDQNYRVCVRYTFTDINCQTCDILICYDTGEASSGGGSGGGSGTGSGTGIGVGNTSGSGSYGNIQR